MAEKIFVGVVVGVLTAVILAWIGINRESPDPGPNFATICVTQSGSCQMMIAMPKGSICTCYNAFGPISSGIAQ